MDQIQLVQRLSEAASQFSWLLGAGASQSAGLPTAWDVMWDLKRRHYNLQENQQISPNDIQNAAVQEKVSAYMGAQGFLPPGNPREYSACFELIFGDDYDRQSRYLRAILADHKISLSVGHRALAAMMASGQAKAVFTTNFDTVVEKAFAAVSGKDIAPFHLEGSYAANAALNDDEFPIYVKMHGDFRYQSIKNLSADLLSQDMELGKCLVSAGNRFGLVVVGYSGRDESAMALLEGALKGPNPFPHGLFWTTMKGRQPFKAVADLIAKAKARGVKAEVVEIETFDSLMSRVWRQLPSRSPELIAAVSKAEMTAVSLPLPPMGKASPILRLNGLPVGELPDDCYELRFRKDLEWADLREAEGRAKGAMICTKESTIWAWGHEAVIRSAFGEELTEVVPSALGERVHDLASNLYLKSFFEQGIGSGLRRGLPLILRSDRSGSTLIVDRHTSKNSIFDGLRAAIGGPLHGQVTGLMTSPTPEHATSEQVYWAECVHLDLQQIEGRNWLVLRPDVWVWPKWARRDATDFLGRRCGGRFNPKADKLLSAWIAILLPNGGRGADHTVTAFDGSAEPGNPTFILNDRTAFSRRLGL